MTNPDLLEMWRLFVSAVRARHDEDPETTEIAALVTQIATDLQAIADHHKRRAVELLLAPTAPTEN